VPAGRHRTRASAWRRGGQRDQGDQRAKRRKRRHGHRMDEGRKPGGSRSPDGSPLPTVGRAAPSARGGRRRFGGRRRPLTGPPARSEQRQQQPNAVPHGRLRIRPDCLRRPPEPGGHGWRKSNSCARAKNDPPRNRGASAGEAERIHCIQKSCGTAARSMPRENWAGAVGAIRRSGRRRRCRWASQRRETC